MEKFNKVEVENFNEVILYIIRHPKIIEPLFNLCNYILQNYKDIDKLIIDYYRDYEDPSWDHIVFRIKSNYDVRQFLDFTSAVYKTYSIVLNDADGWIQLEQDYSNEQSREEELAWRLSSAIKKYSKE